MEERVGFLPAFPATFISGREKEPKIRPLIAARHPGEWPKSREELEEVAWGASTGWGRQGRHHFGDPRTPFVSGADR